MKLTYVLVIFAFILRSSYSENLNLPNVTPEDSLIDNIVVDCSKKASLKCVSKNTYRYLENTFVSGDDWDVTDSISFKKNDRTELPPVVPADTTRQGRGLDDVTDVIYEKGVQFLAGHDLTWTLPQTFFGGSVLKVSAPSDSTSRSLFNVELLAPQEKEEEESSTEIGQPNDRQGRFLFKNIFGKKIKKKLLLGFFALILIIKLIKIKLFFLLPLILGVGTVKKLAIKFLFFIFPALAALFKSCHHHHHHVPVKQYHLHTVKHQHPHHYHDDYHGGHGGPPDWLRRNEYVPETTASSSNSWDTQPSGYYPDDPISKNPISTTEASFYDYANKRTIQAYQSQLQQQAAIVNQRYPQSAAAIPSAAIPTKIGQLSYSPPIYRKPSAVNSAYRAEILPSTDTYDAFYSPILNRLDAVFIQMGFNDEPCRERLVCSMYKTPTRFSPNSNLVSAELSRDPDQLERPTSASEPVIRFYKYVQAAKDGQEQRDCLTLYPSCNVNTEP